MWGWGEGRIKCICNKDFGAFGPQATDHILIPVAETELYKIWKMFCFIMHKYRSLTIVKEKSDF